MATKKYVSLEKLGLYHEKEVARVNGLIKTAKDEAIAHANSLASNYDAAGAAATVQGNLDTEIARAKAAEEANAAAAKQAQDEVDALELVVQNIQENAYDDTAIRGLITGLESNKADKTQVATDIADAVKAEEDARKLAVQGVQDAVNTLSGTHATDKTAMEAAIALKADQTALDAVSGVANAAATKTALQEEITRATGEEARIEGLVTAEAQRAAGVEAGLEERLVEVETFFKTAEGETLNDALDTLVEIQKFVTDEGAAADQMVKDIAANTKAISDMDAAYKAADTTLQGNIDALSGVVNSKAAQADMEALAGRVEDAEGEIDTLQADLGTAQAAIEALQTAVGDGGSVDEMIDSAIETAMGEEETRVDGLLNGKVDKVDGKGLSTNDLTNELKANYDAAYAHSQAAHAPVDAQKNVIETVKVNGSALTITDKAVDIVVPTDNAQLTNGAGYLVASDIANKADKATTLAGYGISDAYTSAQTDTAIANAVGQFVEASEEEINQLFV